MLWYLRRSIKTGGITSSSGSSRTYHRNEKPRSFWLIFSMYSLLTICLLFFTIIFAIRFGVVDIRDAVRTNNVEAVKKYLDRDGDMNAKDERGYTPLLYAARFGWKEIAELLIAKGADVNAKVLEGGTTLHLAAGKAARELSNC